MRLLIVITTFNHCLVLKLTLFSLQVTTHSRLLSSNDLQDIARATSLPLPNVTCLSLQQFHTEQQFCSSVRYTNLIGSVTYYNISEG